VCRDCSAPAGERPPLEPAADRPVPIDTYAGCLDVDRDPDTAIISRLPCFADEARKRGRATNPVQISLHQVVARPGQSVDLSILVGTFRSIVPKRTVRNI
jgi:hypothetical protein